MRGVPVGQERKWTDETIAKALREITGSLGSFPTNTELRQLGRNDLACAVTKTGGIIAWAAKLGLERKDSDSDFGWRGEDLFCELCRENGLTAERSVSVKAPFDVLVDGVLRVDVKTAEYAEYSACRGWFYRIGKQPQADLVALVQFDTRVFYGLYWYECPTSNITISRSGGKYLPRQNNWTLIRNMISVRKLERATGDAVASVA